MTDRGRPVTVRPAEASDLEAVVEVFLGCWTRSYATFLPDGQRRRFDAASARALWSPHFTPRPAPGLVVADRHGEVSGLALIRFPEAASEPAYLASLYVHPDRQGGGTGRLLFEAGAAQARAAGRHVLRWWVFSENAASIAFYRRMGGAPTGRTRQGDYGQSETEMTCPLFIA